MKTIQAALTAILLGAGLTALVAQTGALAQPSTTLAPGVQNAPRLVSGTCIAGFNASPPANGFYLCTSAPAACTPGYRVVNLRQADNALQFTCTNDSYGK
jgi:hypothetical protein